MTPSDWILMSAPKMVMKSSGLLGNRLGYCSCVLPAAVLGSCWPPQMAPSSQLRNWNRPIVTMKTANCDFFAIGRTSVTSAAAPMTHDGDADRDAPLAELVDDVRAEQGHLALREVEVTGAAVDDDEAQRDECVHAALAQAVDESLQEQFHQNPRYAFRIASSALSSAALPAATMRPVSSR
jgi:hypothetical protein